MKILAVLAHPDDEAFGPAGTLSRYSLTGHSVRLATMTQGEAGTLGPARDLTPLELARIRSDELRRSAEALHLTGLNIYTLPDGKLAQLPAEQGIGIIRQEIETFSPDALLTFHTGGISGHPDHQTVARWCLSAIKESNRPLRLFAYGVSVDQARRVTHRKLAPIPDEELTHILDVSNYLEFKFAAIRCHQSQAEAWERMKNIEGGLESYLRNEHFSLVWPAPKQPARTRSTRLED
jgi:LmbE family N-acetylglucosaminyl deacetylase